MGDLQRDGAGPGMPIDAFMGDVRVLAVAIEARPKRVRAEMGLRIGI